MSPIPAVILCCLFGSLLMPAFGAERLLPGRVIRVLDGDSLMLDVQGGHHEIELAEIDAPESNQPWGPSAAAALHDSLTGAFVVVQVTGSGPTGITRGRIDFKGRDVAIDLLQRGLAWSTVEADVPTGAPADAPQHPYTRAEADARAARRGLWSDSRPIPPWQWRRQRGATDD